MSPRGSGTPPPPRPTLYTQPRSHSAVACRGPVNSPLTLPSRPHLFINSTPSTVISFEEGPDDTPGQAGRVMGGSQPPGCGMVGPGSCRHLNVDHWVGQSQEMAHLALGPHGCTFYGSRMGGAAADTHHPGIPRPTRPVMTS